MIFQPHTSRSNLLKKISEFLSIFIAFIGVLILIGWAFNISFLLSPGSGFSVIKSNAGLCFLLIGISLWFVQTKRINYYNQRIAQVLALIVLIIGFLTLMEYIFNINFGLDQILFKEAAGAFNTSSPNRMALTTVINFILAGICILVWNVKTPNFYRPTQILAIIGGFISLIGFLAYIYNVSLFYHIPQFTAISIYATITFILLFLSILLARPETGMMSVISGDNISSILARRLLPLVIILPVIIGFISRYGANIGFYTDEIADIIFLFLLIIFFSIISWITIIKIKKIEDDRKLLEIEYQLSLEEKVQNRTNELEQSNRELELSNKDLQQFAYVTSHDLREPLRMISSFLQLLERRYKDQLDQDADEFIGFAVDGAKRLDTMTQ